eukprot:g1368.t1
MSDGKEGSGMSIPKITPLRLREYAISDTVNRSMISTTCNVAAGLIGAGLMGLVFFKGGRARAAMSGFGAGVGAGLSWEEVHKNLGNLFERN